jgi:hypothetical protein
LLRSDRTSVQPIAEHEHDDQNPDATSSPQIPSS